MKVREYVPEDHAMLATWWEGHDWPVVPQAILPKLGMMVHDGEIPICSGWLYMDNSVGVCMFEWLVTNPKATPMQAARGVKVLVNFMADRAKEMDYGVMLTTCRQASLARMYEKSGFMKTDENVTHLLKMLKN
jgi:hypothetical protein